MAEKLKAAVTPFLLPRTMATRRFEPGLEVRLVLRFDKVVLVTQTSHSDALCAGITPPGSVAGGTNGNLSIIGTRGFTTLKKVTWSKYGAFNKKCGISFILFLHGWLGPRRSTSPVRISNFSALAKSAFS
jgi:hypothetical protein